MSNTLRFIDKTKIVIGDEYSLVDDTYEFKTSVNNYEDLKYLSSRLTTANMSKVTLVDKDGNETVYKNMGIGIPKIYIVEEFASRLDIVIRLKKLSEQEQQLDTMKNVIQTLDDSTALTIKSMYPEWEDLIGETLKIGTKFNYWGFLYKTAQDNLLIQEQYKPGATGTESLYTYIDESHTGTKDDPIPYYRNQILEEGKFYTQDDILYVCTNGSKIAVFDNLEDLPEFVAIFVEGEGTLDDPIPWYSGQILYNSKYYIEDGVTYICNRDSEIPVYGHLKDLAAYVSVYVPEFIAPQGSTPEIPIAFITGMVLERGKYYIEDNIIYYCIKSSDGHQEGKLSTLSEYVEVYNDSQKPEPEPEPEHPQVGEEGTISNPIKFSTGMTLYNGKYYIENEITYLCFRDSDIAIHNSLKDLVNIYVKTATV